MAKSSKLHSASLPLKDYIGDTAAQVLTDMGYGDADARVWKESAPKETPDPWVIYTAREMPSTLMSNRDSEDVRAVAEIRVFSHSNDVEVDRIAGNIQETIVDRTNSPSISGFRAIWHDLVFHRPLNEEREDQADLFGRIMEIEFELEPTP